MSKDYMDPFERAYAQAAGTLVDRRVRGGLTGVGRLNPDENLDDLSDIMAPARNRAAPLKPPPADIKERRQKIREAFKTVQSPAAIARQLDIKPATVYNDLNVMKLLKKR